MKEGETHEPAFDSKHGGCGDNCRYLRGGTRADDGVGRDGAGSDLRARDDVRFGPRACGKVWWAHRRSEFARNLGMGRGVVDAACHVWTVGALATRDGVRRGPRPG